MTETATTESLTCRLMVVGAGMAGVAAAVFAARRGIDTVQVGSAGETLYASGLFDLYGVAPGAPGQWLDDPWQGLDALRKDDPRHPFCHVASDGIRTAIDRFTGFMEAAGFPYTGYPDRNARLITPVGTTKRSFRVPAAMWAGVRALEEKAPCLIVDIPGLLGFSARQIVETLKPEWPNLAAATITPSRDPQPGARYAEHIARELAVPAAREAFADAIRPHLDRAEYVGLPAVLGVHDTETVCQDLKRMLGRPVFEIPTMPPGIAGVRLKEMFDLQMPRLGITRFGQHRVFSARRRPDGRFELAVGVTEPELTVVAENLLIATGRFLGKGLIGERQGIREALLDLPVYQPANRSRWRREHFLDPRGHAVNRAGVEVDARFRPVYPDGRIVYENVYAVGSILAHQDWMRSRSGTGLAVATAFAAVEAMVGG